MASSNNGAIFMKLSKESCFSAAAGFASKKDLKAGANSEYQWLCRNGLLDQACQHMKPIRRSFSDADIAEIASKHSGRRQFKLADQSAYNAAKSRGILDSVCAHMDIKYRVFSDDELRDLASKYSTLKSFYDADNAAYQTADRRGILADICSHMEGRSTRRLSDEEIIEIASHYKTRNDFKLGDFGAYTTAIRRGLIVDASAHMEPGSTGFREDLPAVVYQFQIDLPDGSVVYKVGITNRKPRQRLTTMGVIPGYKAKLVGLMQFDLGRDARITEKRLHRRAAKFKYAGPPVMANGNTELFTENVFNL